MRLAASIYMYAIFICFCKPYYIVQTGIYAMMFSQSRESCKGIRKRNVFTI